MRSDFDAFFLAYLDTAVFASTSTHPDDPGAEPIPIEEYGLSIDDISDEARKTLQDDARDFWGNNPECHYNPEQAGHDFWLTRNRHGAGFWDGDWPQETGRKLTDAAHAYGECDLYLDCNEKLHVE